MLNRSCVIVRPNQPYIDWAAQLDDTDILPSADDERTIYLVPEYDDDDEALAVLKASFEFIFVSELNAWHMDEADWPQDLTFEMFLEWFTVELHSMVVDACAYDLLDDEADEAVG